MRVVAPQRSAHARHAAHCAAAQRAAGRRGGATAAAVLVGVWPLWGTDEHRPRQNVVCALSRRVVKARRSCSRRGAALGHCTCCDEPRHAVLATGVCVRHHLRGVRPAGAQGRAGLWAGRGEHLRQAHGAPRYLCCAFGASCAVGQRGAQVDVRPDADAAVSARRHEHGGGAPLATRSVSPRQPRVWPERDARKGAGRAHPLYGRHGISAVGVGAGKSPHCKCGHARRRRRR